MIFKKGDTFDFTGQVDITDYRGDSIPDLTGWTGRSQIRDSSQNLISNLTFSWTDISNGICRIFSTDNTNEWDAVEAFIDIEFTSPDAIPVIISTSTSEFNIVDGPTV